MTNHFNLEETLNQLYIITKFSFSIVDSNGDLMNDKIDEEEYQIEIDSLMSMFNVPISEDIEQNFLTII